jgi:hypothetical protein
MFFAGGRSWRITVPEGDPRQKHETLCEKYLSVAQVVECRLASARPLVQTPVLSKSKEERKKMAPKYLAVHILTKNI